MATTASGEWQPILGAFTLVFAEKGRPHSLDFKSVNVATLGGGAMIRKPVANDGLIGYLKQFRPSLGIEWQALHFLHAISGPVLSIALKNDL